MALLRLYVSLGIATASSAVAGFSGVVVISHPLAWAFAAATVSLLFGARHCLRALRTTRLSLPGRTADFWQWALQSDVSRRDVLGAYLKDSADRHATNEAINHKASKALTWAKRRGASTPLVAMVAGAAALAVSLMR
jgi:hypothetical protein